MLKTVKIMDAPPETPPDSEEFVRNAIEIHRVCYERWNEFEMVNGVRTHTGYSLRLSRPCRVVDMPGSNNTEDYSPGARVGKVLSLAFVVVDKFVPLGARVWE